MSAGIAQAGAAGARLERACAVAGLSLRTLQRWHREGALKTDGRRREHRPEGTQRTPANRLSSEERDQILEVANTAQFAHLTHVCHFEQPNGAKPRLIGVTAAGGSRPGNRLAWARSV